VEARGGIEPPIKVLQTFALPLGDRASEANLFYHFKQESPIASGLTGFDVLPLQNATG
jgi:hypothetical protein